MKTLYFTISCFLLLTFVGLAQAESAVSQEAIELSNQTILGIYQEIINQKSNYPELKDFGESCLFKNKNGMYVLIYDYKDLVTGDPYNFGITINVMDSTDFNDRVGRFSYGFPALGLKIVGFFNKHPIRTQYDIMPLISKHGMDLAEYQQGFLPLRIFIEPVKDVFKVKENLQFNIILKNVGKRHMVVKSLGEGSLFFLVNNQAWGKNPLSGNPGGKDEILKSGEEIQLKLKGESFQKPQEVEITCFYGMSIDGVNPIAKARVRIEE